MKRYILLMMSLLFVAHAQWPQMYAYLGNPIYEDAIGYRELLENTEFANERAILLDFIDQSDALLFSWRGQEDKTERSVRLNYLNALRTLRVQNDAIHRRLNRRFETLWLDGKSAMLRLLKENPSDFIRHAPAVKRANDFEALPKSEQKDTQKTMHNTDKTQIETAALKNMAAVVPMPAETIAFDDIEKQNVDANATFESSNTGIPIVQELPDTTLEDKYRHSKQVLIQARINGYNNRCLNDVTALYSFLVLREDAIKLNKSCEALDMHQKAEAFKKNASKYCDPHFKTFRDAQKELLRYDKKMLQKQCREQTNPPPGS